jgi:hypothetical protein
LTSIIELLKIKLSFFSGYDVGFFTQISIQLFSKPRDNTNIVRAVTFAMVFEVIFI